MSPGFSHHWVSAVALALLSGPVLACPPGQKKGNSAQSDVNADNVKSDRVNSDNLKSNTSKFRSMVLEQFDANHNGRLDSKERAAANRALSGKGGGPAIEALRKQALVEFDANGNGKLDKPEIHKALSSVNTASKSAQVAANDSSKKPLTAQQREAARELQQQMSFNGITTTAGQIQALENLLTNSSGTLTPAEMALIQGLLAQLLSQAPTSTATTTTIPVTASTGTGSTGTSSSTSTGMCSGSSGSSSSSGSSGTGSSGTLTASAARNSNNQNTNSPFLSGGVGEGGFGGGGGGGFRGFRGR